METDALSNTGADRELATIDEELPDWEEQMQQEEVSETGVDSGRPAKKHKPYEGGAVACSPAMEDSLARTYAIIWALEPRRVPMETCDQSNEWKRLLVQQLIEAVVGNSNPAYISTVSSQRVIQSTSAVEFSSMQSRLVFPRCRFYCRCSIAMSKAKVSQSKKLKDADEKLIDKMKDRLVCRVWEELEDSDEPMSIAQLALAIAWQSAARKAEIT